MGTKCSHFSNDHVHTENEHTLRHLEERVPGASEHDKHDHEKLEAVQNELQMQLKDFTGNESPDQLHNFYLAFSLFQSQYLEHIHEEETVTELLLQKHFTDDELMKHRQGIMQRLEPSMLQLWLKYVVPAQRVEDNIGMLSGVKKNFPQQFFNEVMEILRSEMDDNRYSELARKIN